MTATSSSDRYEAARKALATYEERHGGGPGYRLGHIDSDHPEGNWSAKDSIEMLASALRALVEAPATIETPEEIADAICEPYTLKGITPAQIRDLIIQAVQAGIQAAWESWEPENAPGLVEAPAFAQNELASLATVRADELEDAWESGELAQAVRNTLEYLRSIGGER